MTQQGYIRPALVGSTALVDTGFSWRSPSARLVMDAVLDIIAEAGFEGLTSEEIIARAGLAARALNELPELDALTSAAPGRIHLVRAPKPTGRLRDDLRGLLRLWREPRTRDEVIVAAVLSAAERRPILMEAVHGALDQPVSQAIGAVLSRHLSDPVAAERVQTLSWLLRGLILERLRTGARTPAEPFGAGGREPQRRDRPTRWPCAPARSKKLKRRSLPPSASLEAAGELTLNRGDDDLID